MTGIAWRWWDAHETREHERRRSHSKEHWHGHQEQAHRSEQVRLQRRPGRHRFNKNLLLRINRELGGDLDLARFEHQALWNEEKQRIEMYLVSRDDQLVRVAGQSFAFKAGERLHTENAHKFTLDSARRLALEGGWTVAESWLSDELPYAILRLTGSSD